MKNKKCNQKIKLTIIIALFFVTISSLFGSKVYAQSASAGQDSTLIKNRVKIDEIDKKIIALLGEREKAVRAIGIYKAKNNIASLQAARFKEVLDKAIEQGKIEGLSPEFITELLNSIHKESLRIEDDIKSKK
jgi:chorismate mutase